MGRTEIYLDDVRRIAICERSYHATIILLLYHVNAAACMRREQRVPPDWIRYNILYMDSKKVLLYRCFVIILVSLSIVMCFVAFCQIPLRTVFYFKNIDIDPTQAVMITVEVEGHLAQDILFSGNFYNSFYDFPWSSKV